jgi:hypothetical protein
VDLDNVPIPSSIKREIRDMYPGHNENKHLLILKKLLELGADPNSHDIYKFSPLNYAVKSGLNLQAESFVAVLLKHGAEPNTMSCFGNMPLSHASFCLSFQIHRNMKLLSFGIDVTDILISYNAKPKTKDEANDLRSCAESYGHVDFAVRVREAFPRGKYECEKCDKYAEKKCTACSIVYYCSPECQKQDWKFHKLTCRKNRQIER